MRLNVRFERAAAVHVGAGMDLLLHSKTSSPDQTRSRSHRILPGCSHCRRCERDVQCLSGTDWTVSVVAVVDAGWNRAGRGGQS